MRAIDITKSSDFIAHETIVNRALQVLLSQLIKMVDKKGIVRKIFGFICPAVKDIRLEIKSQLHELSAENAYLMSIDTPRGVRNNNWGNVERGANWKGLASEQIDDRFCTFTTPAWGLRAMIRITRSYYNRHGIRCMEDFFHRYAPNIENDTKSYYKYVYDRVEGNEIQPYSQTWMRDFIKAMCEMENGSHVIQQRWNDDLFDIAYELA